MLGASAERKPVPPFGERHERLRAEIREFVEGELRPHADEWERARSFPDDVFRRMGERGLLGLKYPREYGGRGGTWVDEAVLCEELARCGSGGVAAGIGAHIGIATPPVWKFGTEEQKQRYLVPAIKGEKIAALAITEPDAGSDVASIRTRAERVDGGWRLSGSKTFITNGVRAHFLVLAARTRPEGGHRGLSFFLVDTDRPGITRRPLEKLGWHASDTAEIALDGVVVPDDALLGEEHAGFYLIMANFQWERLLMALGAVGSMRVLLELAIARARARRVRGRPLGSFQAIRHRIAELATVLSVGEALTYHALRLFADGLDAVREVTQAKLFTQRAAVAVADACLQIYGGAGYTCADGVERALRDLRLGPIGGGTDEIMKEILGRQMGL
ncbi:acyl-CoA dehydrogenase family protein [Thermoleophilum album]|uniref:Acyl-CoA dehydrogenase n=1 Tax=Thermoleophilum album TaxID=29539 RepID=A0A1H6FQB9_THEAL|nr:acyl-CoA dehydrogenase family protein [Thermoleophilum album]SEH12043.1 acyl-CoA dehydrogenase [Thermoleophilum album]